MILQSAFLVRRFRILVALLFAGFVPGSNSTSFGQSIAGAGSSSRIIEFEASITSPNPRQYEYFGHSVAIAGDWIVVGAYGDQTACPNQNPCHNSGAAYVYRRSGNSWQYHQKLRASDPSGGAQFGYAVAINGNTIVIGSDYARVGNQDSRPGAGYVFVLDDDQWQEQRKLVIQDQASNSRLGAAVAISHDLIILGAPGYPSEGRAFVFRRAAGSWVHEATLLSWDGNNGEFGLAVAISENVAVATGPGALAPGVTGSGAAYVFRRESGTWRREAKLVPDFPISGSRFGSSVAMNNNRLIVGAPVEKALCQPHVCYPGAAYIFERGDLFWRQIARLDALSASHFGQGTEFGASVAISSDYALVGAKYDDSENCTDHSCNEGAEYVFAKGEAGWNESLRLQAPSPIPGAYYGSSTSATPTSFVIGSVYDDLAGDASGAAFVYRVFVDCNSNGTPDEFDPDCNANESPDDCDIASGTSSDCNGNGDPDECDLAVGLSRDCNGNDIPDECDTLYAEFVSPSLSPIGASIPQLFTLSDPPLTGSDVRLSFEARGDLGSPAEGIEVQLNGQLIGTIFGPGGNDCPFIPDAAEITVAKVFYNQAARAGIAQIRMVGTSAVDPAPPNCVSSISVIVEYQAVTAGDCNGNGIPDFCDVNGETVPDCNDNGSPDECDISSGTSADCNANGIPDECDLTNERSADCNANHAPDECDFIVAGDLDGNSSVDATDFGLLADCLTGPCDTGCPIATWACCPHAQLDADQDVDLLDVALMQNSQNR